MYETKKGIIATLPKEVGTNRYESYHAVISLIPQAYQNVIRSIHIGMERKVRPIRIQKQQRSAVSADADCRRTLEKGKRTYYTGVAHLEKAFKNVNLNKIFEILEKV